MKPIVFLFIFFTSISFAESSNRYPQQPNYTIVSKELDNSISKKKAKITFHITANTKHNKQSVIFADNGKQKTAGLNNEYKFHHTSKAGKHIYEFFLSENFHEIRTDSVLIEGGYRYEIRINFKSSTQQINVRKPVIYLYPETTTDISVEVDVKGELTFTYPTYDHGWNVVADPAGKLNIDGESYRYLFWESNQNLRAEIVDTKYGFFVKQEELTSFLEEKLNAFGFTSEERTDFITYWVPLMSDKKNLYISFRINDQCSSFADLKIKPKPAHIARFYMLWSEIDGETEMLAKPVPQDIPKMEREGFTVLEWGGAEIENLLLEAELDEGKILHNDVGIDRGGPGDQIVYDQRAGSSNE